MSDATYRAAEVIDEAIGYALLTGDEQSAMVESTFEKLHRAGLLATEAHDRAVAARALREAATLIGHSPNCHPDPDRDPYVGCRCRMTDLWERADRIERAGQ